MTTTITRAADLRRVPWRNGQGLTTELAMSGSPDDFTWRVSLADVGQSGDFSLFPGIDRTIVLIEGDAMVLHLPDGLHALRRDVPFAFDGGLAVTCTVERPTRDLNLMTRRGTTTGGIEVLHLDGAAVVAGAAAVTVVVVLDGAAAVDGAGLGAGDVAVLTDADSTHLGGTARVAVVRVDQAG